MIEYICINKESNKTRNCDSCNGITNLYGMYENKLGLTFEEVYSRQHLINRDGKRKDDAFSADNYVI